VVRATVEAARGAHPAHLGKIGDRPRKSTVEQANAWGLSGEGRGFVAAWLAKNGWCAHILLMLGDRPGVVCAAELAHAARVSASAL
jgi:hypothetical protein